MPSRPVLIVSIKQKTKNLVRVKTIGQTKEGVRNNKFSFSNFPRGTRGVHYAGFTTFLELKSFTKKRVQIIDKTT